MRAAATRSGWAASTGRVALASDTAVGSAGTCGTVDSSQAGAHAKTSAMGGADRIFNDTEP